MVSARTRRPAGSKENPARSVRISDEVWESAKRRAAYEGITVSLVLQQIIEGYAKGLVDLPKTQVTYSQPRQPNEQQSA